MRKWISYGFIWLSAILLFGHSLVPHVHVYSYETSVSSTVCHGEQDLGILSKLYSVDLGGEGHLENFLQIKPNSTELNSESNQIVDDNISLVDIISPFFQYLTIGVETNNFHVEKQQVILYQTSFSERLLRAPPVC